MAVNPPAFRRKFPLLVTGSLLALGASPLLHAAEQFNCLPDSSGSWNCSAQDNAASLPRPAQGLPQDARTAAAPLPAAASMPAPRVEPATTVQSVSPPPAVVGQPAIEPAAVVASQPNPYSHLDWVPREQLSREQQAGISPYCSGAYIEPPRAGAEQPVSKDSPTYLSARASRYDQQNQIAVLAGDVVMRQGQLQAEADEASVRQLENQGALKGNVRLRDQGVLVLGQRAELQMDTGEAKIEEAQYVIHQAHTRGSADYVKLQSNSVVHLKDGSYTRCEPGDNAWQLRGNNIRLDPRTGFGTATNVTLRVKDVPVFYTPYIYFPIDDRRQSGFLPPSFSSSGDTGTKIQTPYYLNLAPNYDATLYPTWMSKRGMQMESELRYLNGLGEGQIGGSWLDDQEDERKLQSEYSRQRWLANWQHRSSLENRLLAEVDYSDISDPYYFQDLDTDLGIDAPSYLNQRAGLSWRGDSFTAALSAHAYQMATISEITPYDRLPQFTLEGRLPWQPAGLQFDYQGEFVRFDRSLRNGNYIDENGNPTPWYDTLILGLARANGDRSSLSPAISLPMTSSWGYLTPKIRHSTTHYSLDIDQQGLTSLLPDQQFNSSLNRSIPLYSLDSGLYFERASSWFGSNGRQTLEPRAFYLYVPEKDQSDIPLFDTSESPFSYASLWRDNRFSGVDRIGDENRLSLGLTSRWIEASGFERQTLSVGQALYFADRKVQLPGINYQARSDATSSQSPYAVEYLYRFDHDWRLSADLNWDADSSTTRSGSAMLHYQPADDLNKVINLGYRYRNDTVHYDRATGSWLVDNADFGTPGAAGYIKDYYKISQHDVSTIWPVMPHWNAIARWQYDYSHDRTLEAYGGFEYDSCCWKVRLINRYWVDYNENSLDPSRNDQTDSGIFLQVVFKGLGGVVGKTVDSFLDHGIQGYRQREEQAY